MMTPDEIARGLIVRPFRVSVNGYNGYSPIYAKSRGQVTSSLLGSCSGTARMLACLRIAHVSL